MLVDVVAVDRLGRAGPYDTPPGVGPHVPGTVQTIPLLFLVFPSPDWDPTPNLSVLTPFLDVSLPQTVSTRVRRQEPKQRTEVPLRPPGHDTELGLPVTQVRP